MYRYKSIALISILAISSGVTDGVVQNRALLRGAKNFRVLPANNAGGSNNDSNTSSGSANNGNSGGSKNEDTTPGNSVETSPLATNAGELEVDPEATEQENNGQKNGKKFDEEGYPVDEPLILDVELDPEGEQVNEEVIVETADEIAVNAANEAAAQKKKETMDEIEKLRMEQEEQEKEKKDPNEEKLSGTGDPNPGLPFLGKPPADEIPQIEVPIEEQDTSEPQTGGPPPPKKAPTDIEFPEPPPESVDIEIPETEVTHKYDPNYDPVLLYGEEYVNEVKQMQAEIQQEKEKEELGYVNAVPEYEEDYEVEYEKKLQERRR